MSEDAAAYGYTEDPDLYASDILARGVLADEPGAWRGPKKGLRQMEPLRPCSTCNKRVLYGVTVHGASIMLEPEETCYVLYWKQRTPLPMLTESRAYPVHRCSHG